MSKFCKVIHQTEHRRVHVLGGTNSFTLPVLVVVLLLCSHSHKDVPPNLSGTYPWPRYLVPSTCLGHSNVVLIL